MWIHPIFRSNRNGMQLRWTACGQHALATAMGGTWTSPFAVQTRDHPEAWMAERTCDRQTRAVLWRTVPCSVRAYFLSLSSTSPVVAAAGTPAGASPV